MFRKENHVSVSEEIPKKSESPEKFEEPGDLVSVELNNVNDTSKEDTPKKFEIISLKNKMIKLFLYITFFTFCSVTILLILGKFEQGPFLKETTETINKNDFTMDNVKRFNLEKCLETKNFQDCCMYEDNNGQFLSHPDCTVKNILKIFQEFEEYYADISEGKTDGQPDFNTKEEFDLIAFKRKRRQIDKTRQSNYNEDDYINSVPYANANGNVELDGTEITNMENVNFGAYDNGLPLPNHEAINYIENDPTLIVDTSNQEVVNNQQATPIHYSNYKQIQNNAVDSYEINSGSIEYPNDYEYAPPIFNDYEEITYYKEILPANFAHTEPKGEIHYSNDEKIPLTVQKENIVEHNLADTPHELVYSNIPIPQQQNTFSLNSNQYDRKNIINSNTNFVLNSQSVPQNQVTFKPKVETYSFQQESPIKETNNNGLLTNYHVDPEGKTYYVSNDNVPSNVHEKNFGVIDSTIPQQPLQNTFTFDKNQYNEKVVNSNLNFGLPPELNYNPSIAKVETYALEQKLPKNEMNNNGGLMSNNDYVLRETNPEIALVGNRQSLNDYTTIITTDITNEFETSTSALNVQDFTIANKPSKNNVEHKNKKMLTVNQRDSFSQSNDGTKLNINTLTSRDFQLAKSKINQFQGTNIDLQTSQHSAINSNFNGHQCQLVGATYSMPFSYDASQGTQFAQLVPVTLPKSNSYIVSPYNIMQPNYVYSPPMANPVYPFSYNPYYNSMQNVLPSTTSSLQATTSNGQYYICNPIASPTNNIVNMPGVEIRDNSVHNLQDLLDGSVTFQEVNNKTRASDKCPFDEHMCADNLKCIKRSQICDSHVHCNDASDEAYCSCKYRVGSSRLCDGYFDCPNGEDELGCFGCGSNLFSCDDWTEDDRLSTCVSLEERCDGVPQCPTGKDEEECSILTNKIGGHQMYKVSNSIGFLHRNYKGKWYPACSNPEAWAIDACNAESGPSILSPLTHMIPVQFVYEEPYINSLSNDHVELVSSCVPGRAVYVECPEPTCGLRKLFKNPYRAEEVDTSVENFLSSMSRNQRNANFSDSLLRVVGGKPSQPAAWPWVVSVYRNGVFHCGGTILNPNWIITAAHCVDKYWQYYYEVEAGILRRFSYSPMEQNRFVSHVVPHKDYDRANLKNDLALMRLSAPLRYNRYVRPICLPNEFTAGPNFFKGPTPGTICTAVGWGATVEHGADPDHLREVDVPILSHCKHIEDEIGDEICAGLSEGGRDACQGDSGGPFLCRNPIAKNQWYLAGIVSHGEGCARPNEPGVYTRVSKYIDWIFRHATELMLPKLVPLRHCPGYTCRLTNRCIPKRRRCDKIVDCLVGDDEMDCDSLSLRNLFKNTVRQMYLGTIQNVSYENVNKFEDNIDKNTLKNGTGLEKVHKPEYNLNTTKEDFTSFATSPHLSDKNDHITNIKDTTFLYTDITTENYRVDESQKELILTTETHLTTTEFAYAAVTDDIVSRLNNDADKIEATFLCKRMLEVIPIRKRCNKIVDCQDATDEENCKCIDYLINVRPEAICDGITDCYDLSDENTCDNCTTHEFRCRKSNKCIPIRKKCDGVSDCPLDEDEWDCVVLTNGVTVEFDHDMRHMLNMKGIISINNNGSWNALCANWTGIEPSAAADVCLSLGFTDYKKFQQLSVNSRLLKVRIGGIDSVHDNEKIVLNQDKCDALYVKCSDTTMDLTHQIGTENKFTTTRNLYNMPWNAAIYVDGKYKCIGIILKFNWILTSAACFNETTSLNNHYIAVLLGTMKPYLNVGGPHDQVIRVVDVIPVLKTDMFMLPLEEEIKITRYVKPALFHWQKYIARNKETCFAIDNNLNILQLSIVDECFTRERCFKRNSFVKPNCTSNDKSSGYIVCDNGNGWYPAAFYYNQSLECGFRNKDSYISISYRKREIFQVMDHDGLINSMHPPICNGYRCILGECINKEQICNGIAECSYAEDEDLQNCKESRQQCNLTESCYCLPSELRCMNGKCVHKSAFCDDINDCGDWSDEPDVCDCGNYLKLSDKNKICDGEINCFDKSDENPLLCPCTNDSYVCENSTICLSQVLLCDETKQCPNGDDEQFCLSLVATDDMKEFGEVFVRRFGIWHSGCFPKNMTIEELNSICVDLGFESIYSSCNYLPKSELKSRKPVRDAFNMVHVNKFMKFAIRTGNEPYITFKDDENCNRLFIQCT